MKKVVLMTVIEEDYYSVCLYEVTIDDDVDLEEAIRAAVRQFVETEEGKAYLEEIYGDIFNWGDACIEIPDEILKEHGIHSIDELKLNRDGIVTVWHDENLID